MTKLYLFLFLVLCAIVTEAQCIATEQYPTNAVNSVNSGVVQQITNCNYAGEYSLLAGLVVGQNYEFTTTIPGDFLTLTDLSDNVLASGVAPLVVTGITMTSVRLHVHVNASCVTDTTCRVTYLQCTSCTPPPVPANDECTSVTPIVLVNGDPAVTFTGTTIGATASTSETDVLQAAAVWEAVELTGECNDLTVDYCGTPAGNMVNAFVVYSDCLTEFVLGDYSFDTCGDSNVTISFIGVPAGIYYLPVISSSDFNILGDYVMNVSSVVCPDPPDCATAPIFPADGATDLDAINPITFTWTAPTSGPTPTSYDFYGGTDPAALNLFANVTDTQFEIAVGDYDLLIYWQVVPKNGSAGATGCPIWSFTSESFTFLGYCLNDELGQWPLESFTPSTCDGVTPNDIVTDGYASEYSLVEVTAGQTYRFTSSEPDLITISYDEFTPEAYGVSAVTWTATTTGTVRFYTHLNDDNCGEDFNNRTRSVLCGPSLSVNSFTQEPFKAFPNPVKNILTIKAQSNIQGVDVFNMLGQKVLNTVPNTVETGLDMSALNAGAYFVKVMVNDNVETLRVIKQ